MIQNSEFIAYIKHADEEKPVTGLYVYDISDPTDPKQIAFHETVGRRGVHRIFFRENEGPYAHISAQINSSRQQGYQIVDLSDPHNPKLAGQWWVPGTFPDDPDPWEPLDPHHRAYGVHGVIPHGDRGYCSTQDAGLTILDISDRSDIKILGHVNWCPPFGGHAHTSMPLPGRGLLVEVTEAMAEPADKRIWMIDIHEERQPVMISSFPLPKPPKKFGVESFFDLPGRFGPHNIHENYPNSFISENLIFSTWFNAGMRATDISNPDRPEEVGFFIPPAPTEKQGATQLNDLYVDANGICYVTDRFNGGLYIVEYTGGGH
jgi:hypothetical protein